jgi:hypothetical protein
LQRSGFMKKKMLTLIICDVVLAFIMFAKVSIKKSIFEGITSINADSIYSSNNSITVVAMIVVGVLLGIMLMSSTKKLSQLFWDIILVGVPGVILAFWWKVLEVTGWGYFTNYQEMMAYIGALMVGICLTKIFTYFIKR